MLRRSLAHPLTLLSLFVLSSLLLLGCPDDGDDSTEGGGDTDPVAQSYDVEIEFEGLIGLVPVADDGSTAGAGETASELWGLMVNATDPASIKPPCPDQAPAADDTSYHKHIPRLQFASKYLLPDEGAAGDSQAGAQTELTNVSLAGLDLRIENEALTGGGISLSGSGAQPCSLDNSDTFRCTPHIADFAPDMAEICDGCLGETVQNQFVAARFRFTQGALGAGPLETYQGPGAEKRSDDERILTFTFVATGDYEARRPKDETAEAVTKEQWKWSDALGDGEKRPQARSQVLRVSGLQGPLTIQLGSLADGSHRNTYRLLPPAGETLELKLGNLTPAAWDGSLQNFEDYVGREFRWYYNLSANRPAECTSATDPLLPSMATWNNSFGPPICPESVFTTSK